MDYRTRSRPSSRSSLQSRSSVYSYVESNFRNVPEVYPSCGRPHSRTRSKVLTIDDAPMMLLPKARLRESMNFYNRHRPSYGVVADDGYQGLHISTLESPEAFQMRRPMKSALRRRNASGACRSDADSGISSLKRCVTFENLSVSRSTVYRDEDDSDDWSDRSDDGGDDCMKHVQVDTDLSDAPFPDYQYNELPTHLDTFGDGEQFIHSPKPLTDINNNNRKRRHGQPTKQEEQCKICGKVLTDKEVVTKQFGGVDNFLNWVLSKWGKDDSVFKEIERKDLQYLPRHNFVYRGHVPHFCNFVRQVQLHQRHADSPRSGEPQDGSEYDDGELVAESVEGSAIGMWRKGSDTSSIPEQKEDGTMSGTEGRPGSPSSVEEEFEKPTVVISRPDSAATSTIGIEIKVTPVSDRIPSSLDQVDLDSDEGIDMTGHDDLSAQLRAQSPPPPFPPPEAPSTAWDNGNSLDLPPVHIPLGKDTTDTEDNEQERAESPRQPPPTPEPIPPKAPDKPPPSKRRACINKKVKKPVERVRKEKEMEQKEEKLLVSEPEKGEPPPPPVQEERKEIQIEDIKVPDLPTPEVPEERERHPSKQSGKAQKHLIIPENDLFRPDPSEILNEQMRSNRREVDWTGMDMSGHDDSRKQQPVSVQSWIQVRLALSQQSSRFELPMDMKDLETMPPQEYIRKHCRISSRRQKLYDHIYRRNRDLRSGGIMLKDLEKSLKDVLVNTLTSEQIQEIIKMLEIDESTKIDSKLFSGIAAFAERMLYPKYVTQDTENIAEYKREKIECADFCALDWKFHGVNVNPKILQILSHLS